MDTAIFDADSHLMETAEWLGAFADPPCATGCRRSGWTAPAPGRPS